MFSIRVINNLLKEGNVSSKKIKKEQQLTPTQDPNLEPVDEDRAFEIEYDEETNEVVFVMHYRRHWGDDMDADVEHGLTLEENNSLICSLMEILEVQKQKLIVQKGTVLEVKSTHDLIEGNPGREFKDLKDVVDQVMDEGKEDEKDD